MQKIDMETRIKSLLAATASVALLSAGFSTARAQSVLLESGSSTLADVYGVSTGSDALHVSWFVLQNTATLIYTYGYNLSTTDGSSVNEFNVSFNAAQPGETISGTGPVGGNFYNNGVNGLAWSFANTTSSALLAFQSNVGPTMGNAAAVGSVPPSPWSTINGNPVPVPRSVPEPATLSLLGMMLGFKPARSLWRRITAR